MDLIKAYTRPSRPAHRRSAAVELDHVLVPSDRRLTSRRDYDRGLHRRSTAQPRVRRLLFSDHFSVDGTLIEAWASIKSFKPKDLARIMDQSGNRDPSPGTFAEPMPSRTTLRAGSYKTYSP
ncbi:hypothetical protein [Methylobacterium sp. Leaf94]|uniref:hypothetical protein n=1 Tax=Methylobacterium sp. Leaf94 TaxID=1736250 RepID=UPI000AE30618|nr:hypothetical protein [Methylobacterium sp. Leaf94]